MNLFFGNSPREFHASLTPIILYVDNFAPMYVYVSGLLVRFLVGHSARACLNCAKLTPALTPDPLQH